MAFTVSMGTLIMMLSFATGFFFFFIYIFFPKANRTETTNWVLSGDEQDERRSN